MAQCPCCSQSADLRKSGYQGLGSCALLQDHESCLVKSHCCSYGLPQFGLHSINSLPLNDRARDIWGNLDQAKLPDIERLAKQQSLSVHYSSLTLRPRMDSSGTMLPDHTLSSSRGRFSLARNIVDRGTQRCFDRDRGGGGGSRLRHGLLLGPNWHG